MPGRAKQAAATDARMAGNNAYKLDKTMPAALADARTLLTDARMKSSDDCQPGQAE